MIPYISSGRVIDPPVVISIGRHISIELTKPLAFFCTLVPVFGRVSDPPRQLNSLHMPKGGFLTLPYAFLT